MVLGKNVSGPADFSFDYFTNNGFIGCKCSQCFEKIIFNIDISKSGKPVEQIPVELNGTILNQLIENKIINLKKDVIKGLGLSKYSLWHLWFSFMREVVSISAIDLFFEEKTPVPQLGGLFRLGKGYS